MALIPYIMQGGVMLRHEETSRGGGYASKEMAVERVKLVRARGKRAAYRRTSMTEGSEQTYQVFTEDGRMAY